MFDNIGKKIKKLAMVICWLGIIASLFFGALFLMNNGDQGSGIGFMLIGVLASWIGSFFIYGFGELIDKAAQIERNTQYGYNPSYTSENSESAKAGSSVEQKLKKLKEDLELELITKEEYEKARAEIISKL